jgi:hydroxyacid-oxoacid transhydrogenase
MQGNGGADGAGGSETIFTMEATPLKYGPGAAEEVGWEVKRLGVGRVMLVSDPGVVEAGITSGIRELIEGEGVEVEVWSKARVEPTANSLQAAADFAVEGEFDGFVAVGGGTSIDTAKVSDLIATTSMPPWAVARSHPRPSSPCWRSRRPRAPAPRRQRSRSWTYLNKG